MECFPAKPIKYFVQHIAKPMPIMLVDLRFEIINDKYIKDIFIKLLKKKSKLMIKRPKPENQILLTTQNLIVVHFPN